MANPQNPAVTLVVAGYNHGTFVEQALESAFSQTYDNYRVIVTDDASSDGSQDVIRNILKVRGWNCETVFHSENRGVCATFNQALDRVDTPYVAFMAADDVMEPHRLARQVPILETAGESFAVACSDAEFIGRDGSVVQGPTMSRSARSAPWGQPEFFQALIQEPLVLAPSALIRTEALRGIGGYDEGLQFEDWDVWLRLAAQGHRFVLIDEKLVRYRQLDDSLMRSLERTPEYRREEIKILRKHVGDPRLVDCQLTPRLYHHAVTLYKAGFPSRGLAPLMFAQARRAKDVRALIFGCMALFRVPGQMFAGDTSAT
jgi:glycosyltransferase involved in cell wall biosynthesis